MFIYTNLLPGSIAAIALWPFVLIRPEYRGNATMHQHERIHLRQQIEMLVIPFYLWYLIEYLVKLIRYGDHFSAYVSISFEVEAYKWQRWLNYLEFRRPYFWIRYL